MTTPAIAAILQIARENRARALRHDTVAHAALFDGLDIRVVEADGREHVGSPVIAPGAWESIGVRRGDRVAWFHASALVEVQAVPSARQVNNGDDQNV